MRIALSVIVFTLAGTLFAQEQSVSDKVTKVALTSLRYHPFVVEQNEDLRAARFVVSDAAIGGAEASLRKFLDRRHGQQVVDEILASYHSNSTAVQRLQSDDVSGFQVRPLDAFSPGPDGYSWSALHEAFPQVRSVVRLSRPAFDRLGTFAVVRYERIPESGHASASFFEFVKNADGSWAQKQGMVGDLWQ